MKEPPLSVADYDLFLMAHPDDDLFVRPLLAEKNGINKVVVFLTNGQAPGPATPEQRRREATRALNSLGVTDLVWSGIDVGIDAGSLPQGIQLCHASVQAAVSERGRPRRIITHAWEGGHPDHDAAHLVGLALAREHQIIGASRSAPYYRAPRAGVVPFLVMSPLSENGPVERIPLRLEQAIDMLRAVGYYPSQLIPMVGLSPGMFLSAIFGRSLNLQSMDNSSAPARPMRGQLLYERRNGLSFEDFVRMVRPFLDSHKLAKART